jgi:acyl-CoA synthetase (AMP-forming)/AMP-acid ligase II
MSALPPKKLPAKNRGTAGVIALLKDLKKKMADPNGYTIADVWEQSSDKFASRPAMHYVGCELFPAHTLTFRQVEQRANQVAHWALDTVSMRAF